MDHYYSRFEPDEVTAVRLIAEDVMLSMPWLTKATQVEVEVVDRIAGWSNEDESDNDLLKDCVQISVAQMSALRKKARQ